jgi:hypothetical protein
MYGKPTFRPSETVSANTCAFIKWDEKAGLLFLCLEHVKHWERIASRRRPAFSWKDLGSGSGEFVSSL